MMDDTAGIFLLRKGFRQIAFADAAGAFDENGFGTIRGVFPLQELAVRFSLNIHSEASKR